MNLNKKISYILFILIFSFLLISCVKKEEILIQEVIQEIKPTTHKWYCFTNEGIKEVTLPKEAPSVLIKPWTEAIRISSALVINDTSYFTVNRAGLLICDGVNQPFLHTGSNFFKNKTVGFLANFNGFPVFHVYKNFLFNTEDIKTQNLEDSDTFLIQYKPETNIMYPLVKKSDIGVSPNAEITEYFFNDRNWYISVKETGKEKNDFSYIKFSTQEDMTNIWNKNRKENFQFNKISSNEYREQLIPLSFKDSPERLQSLLSVIPDTFPFFIKTIKENQTVPCTVYSNCKEQDNALEAFAVIGETYTAALFPDGTTYFAGAINKGRIANKAKTICFKLPKLPTNFVYGVFTISGSKMYASWEQVSFYKTGKSGFIVVDLNKIIY